ncbi:TPA: OsmC family protein [Serratia marcescens]|nr:OsmC family protein [Serratia marcescens]
MSAAGSCFLMSLTYILQNTDIEVIKVQINSVGKFEVSDTGIRFRELEHVADITLEKPLDNQNEAIADIIEKADERCMVSHALPPTVKTSVIPRILIHGK